MDVLLYDLPILFPEFLDKCGGAFIWLAHSVPRVSGQVWRCFYVIGPFCSQSFWISVEVLLYDWPILFCQSFWTSVENCTRPCSSHPIVPATLSLSPPQMARTRGALTKATTCQQMALIPWLFSALCTLCVTESTTGKMDGGWEWSEWADMGLYIYKMCGFMWVCVSVWLAKTWSLWTGSGCKSCVSLAL